MFARKLMFTEKIQKETTRKIETLSKVTYY